MFKKVLAGILSVILLAVFPLFGFAEQVELTFTHWDVGIVRTVLLALARNFEKSHPNIKVKVLDIPYDRYDEKITAMVAAGNPPDLGYGREPVVLEWAEKGVLLDLTPFIKKDPDPNVKLENRIPFSWYLYDRGKKVAGSSVALEIMVLWYNKDMFDKAGLAYPSPNPDKPWTYKDLIEAATKLTVDRNGKHPDEPGFDPTNIKTFGVSFSVWYASLLPFIRSNGGDFYNEAATEPLIDHPEAVEAIQFLADLIYKYHVAPTPAQLASLPSLSIALQTQQVAMAIDGQWALSTLSKAAKGRFKLGVAPLPIFKKPVGVLTGGPIVMFSGGKHKEEAWEFYKWLMNPENVLPVMRDGLWMPVQKSWFTDPKLLKRWIDPTTHPPEYKQAVVDYLLKYGTEMTYYMTKNWPKIETALNQGLSNVFLGHEDAKAACTRIANEMKSLLIGRYDR